jgi:hypothetical protein
MAGWFKEPAAIDLRSTGHSGSHEGCYLRHLNSCSEKLSREHMVSENVLRIIGGDKIKLTGVPFLKGESREIGLSSLVSKCLCTAHNSALSELDIEAGRLYRAMLDGIAGNDAGERYHMFSGHDIERWLLKVAAGLAASGWFATGGTKLPGVFAENTDIVQLLEEPYSWMHPMGLYFIQRNPGEIFEVENQIQFQPLASAVGELAGIIATIHGIMMPLALLRSIIVPGSSLEGATYRPKRMNLKEQDVFWMMKGKVTQV